jgi:paraquat-inducible protein A
MPRFTFPFLQTAGVHGATPPLDAATERQAKGNAEWIECPDCGQMQALPSPRPGRDRVCSRCASPFGCGTAAFDTLLALSLSSLMIFAVVTFVPLLGISIEGRQGQVALTNAANGLFSHNMLTLGMFVVGLIILMPLAHMLLQTYVLFCLWRGDRPPGLARCFLWSERVRPWAMLEVLLLGLFITVSKLRDLAQVHLFAGVWSLGALTALFVAYGAVVDRQKIWDAIEPPPYLGLSPGQKQWIGCTSCNLLHEAPAPACCRRCTAPLHYRKPDSIVRTWALVLAGFVLYIPANLYPVMTVVNFGRTQPTTILQGVRQLWDGQDWPYAILVFTASIVIPLAKLLGLTSFLLTFHLRNKSWLVHCTKLYRLFDKIGRWSMLDIFVAAILCSLVDFGNLAAVLPGEGLAPFAAVVILTMTAVNCFDPRLMWDAARRKND